MQGVSRRDVLSADERTRAEQIPLADDRTRFVVTRKGLRDVLRRYLGSPAAVAFAYGPYGKPMLAPTVPQRLEFNVSHAEGLALVAVSLEMPVGVDVEPVRPLDDLADLAEQVFSPAERAAWDRLPESERLAGFFEAWTRKEAVLKGLGDGLSRPLREVEVFGRRDADLWWDPTVPNSAWRLTSFAPQRGYVACVAAKVADAGKTVKLTGFDFGLEVTACSFSGNRRGSAGLDAEALERLRTYLAGDL
ncbi:MAG: 4'-phosphopantetheinyl transferase superfamily protein [Anaerolineae bacterium]